MKKIKIVNILEESRFGGPHERIITIANILKKKTNTIIIAPKKNNDLFKKKMKKKKLNFIFLNTQTLKLNVRSIIFYIFFFFSDILKLRRNIKKLNPDIIHVSGGAWQFRSILASLNLKSKILWHLNDSKSNFLIIIIFFFVNFFAHGFIFSSLRTKKYYSRFIIKKKPYKIINAPVFKFNGFRKLKKNKIIIGNIGNFNKNKSQDLIIKTACELKKFNNYKFILVGQVFENQKKYYNYLIKLIKKNNLDNVQIIINPKNVHQYFKEFDIYFCSSKFESSPTSVWNALASGCSLISTDVGDVKILNKKNKFFNLIKSLNPNKISYIIKSIKIPSNKKEHKIVSLIAKKNFDKKIIATMQYNFYKVFI